MIIKYILFVMLVTFAVSPLGIGLSILLIYFLVEEFDQLNQFKEGAVGFTIAFIVGFGGYAGYIIKEGIRVMVYGKDWKNRVGEILKIRQRLLMKRFVHMGLSILYLVLSIVTLVNKIESPTIFYSTRFFIVLPFALAYATIVVCNRMNLSKLICFLVVLSMLLYLSVWGISKGTHRINNLTNVCADDSLLLLVAFFVLLNWNHLATCAMFIIFCGITVYFAGFNQSYCQRKSAFINQQLMLKIISFTLIGMNLIRSLIILFINPNFFQLPPFQQIAPLQQFQSQINLNSENNIQKRLQYLQINKRQAQSLSQTCSICLFQFSSQKQIVTLPCNHTFDYQCVVQWLCKYPHCPNCRKIVQPLSQ